MTILKVYDGQSAGNQQIHKYLVGSPETMRNTPRG